MRLKICLILLISLLIPTSVYAVAIDAATAWEFEASTSDSAQNGAGFANLDPGTSVDYTQQASAQLTLTDGATGGIGNTTFTSATGGFTAAMVGNVLKISSGTNTVNGYFQITVHTDTNTVTLNIAPDDGVGGVSGANFKVAGALDIFVDSFFDGAGALTGPVAGNTIHIKNETMTLGENIAMNLDGTLLLPITVDGYNSSRGDNPTGTDRPLIVAAARDFNFDNNWMIKNLRVTGTDIQVLRVDVTSQIVNCKAENSSSTADRAAFQISNDSIISLSEGVSTKGRAINMTPGTKAFGCYFRDSKEAVRLGANDDTSIIGCVVESNVIGVSTLVAADSANIVSCTFINNTTAVNVGATSDVWAIFNNILKDNITGVAWGDADMSMYMDYNVWDNTTDVSGGIAKGDNAITGDPTLNTTIITGSDGTTEAGDENDFRSAGATFQADGVSTDDTIILHSGTSVTAGVYTITAIVNETTLTISAGATTSASSVVYGIVTNEDFTVQAGSNALDAGLQIGVPQGVTGDYKWNVGTDQDDNTAAGGSSNDVFGWI